MPCALEREGEGPTDLCDGAAGAPVPCARVCVCCPPASCVGVCWAASLLIWSVFMPALGIILLRAVIAELLNVRGFGDVNVVDPFPTEETNLGRKVAALPALPYSARRKNKIK